ncbi:MAG: hypothetical protein ACK4Z6_03235 [Candidatus Methylomirabilales bacterium]
MTAAMLISRFQWNAPFLPELLAEALFAVVPMSLFTFSIRLLGKAAKWTAFGGAIAAHLMVGTILGGFLGLGIEKMALKSLLRTALLYSFGLWVLTAVMVLPALGAGFFGNLLPLGPFLTSAFLLGDYLIYGLSLAWTYAGLTQGQR